jgi:hypothetical protein
MGRALSTAVLAVMFITALLYSILSGFTQALKPLEPRSLEPEVIGGRDG